MPDPFQLTALLRMLLIPILLARLLVVVSYEDRTHKFWTSAFPTAAFLILVFRIVINDLAPGEPFPLDGWITALTWLFVLVTQTIATIYGWWPSRPSGKVMLAWSVLIVGLIVLFFIAWGIGDALGPSPSGQAPTRAHILQAEMLPSTGRLPTAVPMPPESYVPPTPIPALVQRLNGITESYTTMNPCLGPLREDYCPTPHPHYGGIN